MTAATDALKEALQEAEADFQRVEAATSDAIREGELASQKLKASRRRRDEIATAIQDLESIETGTRTLQGLHS